MNLFKPRWSIQIRSDLLLHILISILLPRPNRGVGNSKLPSKLNNHQPQRHPLQPNPLPKGLARLKGYIPEKINDPRHGPLLEPQALNRIGKCGSERLNTYGKPGNRDSYDTG